MRRTILCRKLTITILIVVSISLLIFACATRMKKTEEPTVENNEKLLQQMIEGGKLYDKWWIEVSGVEEPKTDHPLWSLQTTNKRTGSDTWRCNECHGWDFLGRDGAYGSGSHKTNFPGAYNVRHKSIKDIEAILLGSTNPNHNFSYVLDYDSIYKLALFLKEGLVNMRLYISYEDKRPFRSNPEHGKKQFEKECVKCHGAKGNQLNFGTDSKPEYIGTIANDDPLEFVHKVRFGQPGTIMPALRIKLKLSEEEKKMPSGIQTGYTMDDVMDILEYARTLPQK